MGIPVAVVPEYKDQLTIAPVETVKLIPGEEASDNVGPEHMLKLGAGDVMNVGKATIVTLTVAVPAGHDGVAGIV
jgi:hypothetical protein